MSEKQDDQLSSNSFSSEIQAEFDCQTAVILKLIERIERMENTIDLLGKALEKKNLTNIDLTTQRAIIVANNLDKKGHLTRSDVIRLLNKCHHNYALKVMRTVETVCPDIKLDKSVCGKWYLTRK